MEDIHKRFFAVLCCAVPCLIAGCATRPGKDAGADVAGYQRKIDDLESAVRLYQLRAEQAGKALDRDIGELAAVRERAEGMAGTLEELAELFDEYTGAVDRIIRDYRALQAAASGAGQDTGGSPCGPGNPHGGDGSGVHPVRQGGSPP